MTGFLSRFAGYASIDPALVSGHSLRAGYVTSCCELGMAPMIIAEQTWHKSLDMLLVYAAESIATGPTAGRRSYEDAGGAARAAGELSVFNILARQHLGQRGHLLDDARDVGWGRHFAV